MVTARDSIHDQLLNFANGADDYITKPYALAIVKVHIGGNPETCRKTEREGGSRTHRGWSRIPGECMSDERRRSRQHRKSMNF